MRLALVGYGRMGQMVDEVARARGHEIVARLDLEDNRNASGLRPDRLAGADVAIEFSEPEAAPANLEALASCRVDAVAGTTGWYEQLPAVCKAVEEAGTGLIYAPNFSLGVQALFQLVRQAAALFERLEDYDPYILEAHHRHKLDQPSGTARQLADLLLAELTRKRRWASLPGEEGADPTTLQVAAVRAGEIPGLHRVVFEGPDDSIELRHEARNRQGFARGAVAAAEWIHGRSGVFTLEDMLRERWS